MARMRVVEMGRKGCGGVEICFGSRAIRLASVLDVGERGNKDVFSSPHPFCLLVPLSQRKERPLDKNSITFQSPYSDNTDSEKD